MKLRTTVSTVCCLLTLGAVHSAALACSPLPPLAGQDLFPADGATDVPLNTEVRVHWAGNAVASLDGLTDIALAGPDGVELAATVEDIAGHQDRSDRWAVLRPDAPLAAETEYTILTPLSSEDCWDPGECLGSERVAHGTFVTGTEEDLDAPSFAGAGEIRLGSDSCDDDACCGPYSARFMTLSWDRVPDEAGILYNIYRAGAALRPVARYVAGTFIAIVGSGGCSPVPFQTSFREEDIAGASYVVRAVDGAGNEDTNSVVLATGGDCVQAPVPPIEPDAQPDAQPDAGPGPDTDPAGDSGPAPDAGSGPDPGTATGKDSSPSVDSGGGTAPGSSAEASAAEGCQGAGGSSTSAWLLLLVGFFFVRSRVKAASI